MEDTLREVGRQIGSENSTVAGGDLDARLNEALKALGLLGDIYKKKRQRDYQKVRVVRSTSRVASRGSDDRGMLGSKVKEV